MNISKSAQREIADLLRSGKDETARVKVEAIIREDYIAESLEVLDVCCELIMSRLGAINIAKTCPPEILEALSTVIWATTRVKIDEFLVIRKLMVAKFGKPFVIDCMNNRDHCVNERVVHRLSIQMPESATAYRYLNEIAQAYQVKWSHEIPQQYVPAQPEPVQSSQASLAFPQVPSSSSSKQTTSLQPSFPDIPRANSGPVFPDVPSKVSKSSPAPAPSFPSFPSVPSEPEMSIPVFNPSELPGGQVFPSVPSGKSTAPNFPDFPSPPSSTTSTLSFPSTPSSTTSTLSFPSTPSSPSSTSSFAFDDKDVPDFDELTARFEKLKKRGL